MSAIGLPGVERPRDEDRAVEQLRRIQEAIDSLGYYLKRAMDSIRLTGQTATITGSVLLTKPAAGRYLVLGSIRTTTTSAAGAAAFSLGFTDDAGAETPTPIAAHSLMAAGQSNFSQFVTVASGDLTYSVTLSGVVGSPQFAIDISVFKVP